MTLAESLCAASLGTLEPDFCRQETCVLSSRGCAELDYETIVPGPAAGARVSIMGSQKQGLLMTVQALIFVVLTVVNTM